MADNLSDTGMAYRSTRAAATSGANPPGKLWQPVWSGEVIHAYDEYNIFEPLVTSKTIPSGRVMEFPITGTIGLEASWDAGEELMNGNNSKATTFQVTLDKRPMAAHFDLDNIDLMVTQWEYRAELARQAGQTLANARDKQIAAYLIRAGAEGQRSDADASGDDDPRPSMSLDNAMYGDTDFANLGNTSSSSSQRIEAALKVLQAIEDFAVHLQENNIPTGGVYCAITPQAFMDIRSLGVARASDISKVYGTAPMFGGVAEAGGLGAQFTQGLGALQDSLEYMGTTIIKTNHIPRTDAPTLGEARYNLDFDAAGIQGLIWQDKSVAALRLQGLKVDTVDDIRRNTTFTVASMMGGTGVLRPECAAVICDVAHANRAALDTALGDNMVAEYGGTNV